MLKLVGALGVLVCISACRQKVRTDAEVAFAVGSWWADSRSNLLIAVAQQSRVSFCLDAEGQPDRARFEKDSQNFSTLVRFAFLEWFRGINLNVTIQQLESGCQPDVAKGIVRVVLHYNESVFQREISQSSSPTLGVYLVGDGSLFLNMAGVTNPRRDSTGGRKTILHELGHAFGLHHSITKGAVMQANLSAASENLTADDILGLENVWKRVSQSARNNQTPTTSATPRPISGQTWANVPSPTAGVVLSMRHDTWLKVSTEQSAQLAATQKCALSQGQKLRVKVLNGGRPEAAHLKVQLEDDVTGCALGRVGSVGYLYQAHID
jgi:hypothetical protein